MNEIILALGLFLGTLRITSYQSIENQTDSSPYHTSIGEHVYKGGAAISRDLHDRWGGPVRYGDYVSVEGLGVYRINDVMNDTRWDKVLKKRVLIRNSIDIWVSSLEEEKLINVQHRKVYLYKRKTYEKTKKS